MWFPELAGELILFFVALLLVGDVLLFAARRVLGRQSVLTLVERGIIGFYAAAGLLYVIAYTPGHVFTTFTVYGVLAAGAILWVLFRGRRALRTLRRTAKRLDKRLENETAFLVMLAASVLLLLFGSYLMGGMLAPNSFDGSIQTIFITLLLHDHSAAFTLEPFAQMGVVYPQGATVLLGTSSILFGWSAMMAPVYLPSLFPALFLPAIYAWTLRVWKGPSPKMAAVTIALFLGLVGTWPRLLLLGSYDFLISLPLLMVLLGVAPGFIGVGKWEDAIMLGAGIGILTALSPVSGALFVLICLVLVVLGSLKQRGAFLKRLGALAASTATGVVFVFPNIVASLEWWGYPGHVLAPSGGQEIPMTGPQYSFLSQLPGYLDPFLFRQQDIWLSPFESLKVLIAVLLVAGALLLIFRIFSVFPLEIPVFFTFETLAGVGATILAILVVVILLTWSGVSSLPTNLQEISIILFLFFTIIAALPLVIAGRALSEARSASSTGKGLTLLVAALVVAVPLTMGAGVTILSEPQYIDSESGNLANVTQGDLAALSWAGAHLPSCSSVLVAQGSAAEFLPAYATVHMLYPMEPPPRNQSYYDVVSDLTTGSITYATLSNLEVLGVTEIFVTGQTNVDWKPFLPQPLLADNVDFSMLFHSADAYVFEFQLGAGLQNCTP